MIKNELMPENVTKEILISNELQQYILLRINIKENKYRTRAISIINRYIDKHYLNKSLEDINYDFFERFYSFFLPTACLGLTNYDIEEISKEWFSFIDYIDIKYCIKSLKKYIKKYIIDIVMKYVGFYM